MLQILEGPAKLEEMQQAMKERRQGRGVIVGRNVGPGVLFDAYRESGPDFIGESAPGAKLSSHAFAIVVSNGGHQILDPGYATSRPLTLENLVTSCVAITGVWQGS